jgi:zinc transporter ZupT
MGEIVIDDVFWVKIAFIVVCFFEAFISGVFVTFSKGCRESPKILGIANSFAAGVFIAIAIVHILPEEAALWEEIYPDAENLFPLPYFLMFCGYTLILILDRVAFDSKSLLNLPPESTDPVD